MVFVLTLLYYLLSAYFYVLIAYVILSWIPDIKQSRFYYVLHLIADPYMRLFRGIIVIGQFDFTPIIGFIVYNFGLYAFGEFIAMLA